MTTLSIAYNVSDETVATIKSHLDDVALRNSNWNGAKFQILRDDYTSISNDDAESIILLHEIFNIINGE